jgi:hypothetical protein
MFLVGDDSPAREARIRAFLSTEPAIAVILSAVHFEWTVRRAVLALGRSPNVAIRAQMLRCHGLDQYKDLWRAEVVAGRRAPGLAQVVRRWPELRRAFALRHRLVHGALSCTTDHAAPRVEIMLAAAANVRSFCAGQGVNLHERLPVRRKPRP